MILLPVICSELPLPQLDQNDFRHTHAEHGGLSLYCGASRPEDNPAPRQWAEMEEEEDDNEKDNS